MFLALAGFLVAFSVRLPVLAAPTSPYDPFRVLSLHVQRSPDPPICCLIPLPPVEPVQDDVLLSFEEWKAKQLTLHELSKQNSKGKGEANQSGHASAAGDLSNGSDATAAPALSSSDNAGGSPLAFSGENSLAPPNEVISPHFRVPLTDRFNYASLDCSARVHTAHREAKSPSSILSSKKDKYMLSPCNPKHEGDKHFVVVELCEDIMIDTVQLANFEFFSGVFKEFTVSVAKTYTTWTVAGTYKAKNIRGVQVRLIL